MIYRSLYYLIILIFGIVTACATPKKELAERPQAKSMPKENVGGKWIINTFRGRSIRVSTKALSLIIDTTKHRVSGQGPCNNFGGRVITLTEKKIQLAGVHATKKACPDLQLESDYLQLLNAAASYKVEDNQLYLYDNASTELLSFYKSDQGIIPQQLHDIWLAKKLNGQEITGLNKQAILEINLNRMDIIGNNGCNEIAGKIHGLSDKTIRFKEMAMTEMYCEDHNVSEQYSEALADVRAYRLDGLWLYLMDDRGTELLIYHKVD